MDAHGKVILDKHSLQIVKQSWFRIAGKQIHREKSFDFCLSKADNLNGGIFSAVINFFLPCLTIHVLLYKRVQLVNI